MALPSRLEVSFDMLHRLVQKLSFRRLTFLIGEQMEIGELALEIWQSGMIAPLSQRLVKLLLEAIDDDRAQQTPRIPVEAVKGTILSFVEVSRDVFQVSLYVVFVY